MRQQLTISVLQIQIYFTYTLGDFIVRHFSFLGLGCSTIPPFLNENEYCVVPQ